MANKYVTIYFYEMQFNENTGRKLDNGKYEFRDVDIDILKSELMTVFRDKINNYNAFRFGENDKYSIEIINSGKQINTINMTNNIIMNDDTKYIFGKIGNEKDIVNYQRRNKDTLQSHDLVKEDNEIFESFTYFYLFFEKIGDKKVATVAFLSFLSAPGIRKLDFLHNYMSSPNYEIHFEPIVSKDCLPIIMNKGIINSIKYTVSLPSDDILAQDIFGLSERDFDDMRNLKNLNLTISLQGERSKNIFNNKNIIKNIFDNIRNFTNTRNGSSAMIVSKAKNCDEKMLEYSFLDNKFISKSNIEFENEIEWQNEVEKVMHKNYLDIRLDLLHSLRG